MATRFPVSYSAQAAMYANGTPSQAAGTYYLQGGASDVSQIIEGNLRVTGDLQVDGNEVVGGSLAAASMAAAGAVTGATVAASGAVTGATVAASGSVSIGGANVPGSNLSCPGGSTQTLGNILCNSVSTTSGGVIVPNPSIIRNSALVNQAPGVMGLGGTRTWTVSLPPNVGNPGVDVGLNALFNDTVPHLFYVMVSTAPPPGQTRAPFTCALMQSYPTAFDRFPDFLANVHQGGYDWSNQSGIPGNYNLGVVTGNIGTTVATVTITMIL